MGKKSKAKQQLKSPHSSIPDHKRSGRRLVPPMRQLENMQTVPWLRDLFPDMLWICGFVADDPRAGIFTCSKILDAIADALPPLTEEDPLIIKGTLTSLEALPEELRRSALAALDEKGLYDLAVPEGFAHCLGMYSDAPGQWLLAPWKERGIPVDWEIAHRHLKSVIRACADGRSLASTAAKHVYFRAYARAGRLHFSSAVETVKLLSRYPDGLSEDELNRVDAFVRAGFLAMIKMGDDIVERRMVWAKAFWRKNWTIFPCTPEVATPTTIDDEKHDHEGLRAFAETLKTRKTELETRFLEKAQRTDPDLYLPDRFEVLTGLVARSLRLLAGAIQSPLLWTDEYGTPLLRSIVEAKIVFHWLVARNDASLFTAFKEYGRGHLKLLALHVREYLSTMNTPPPALVEYAEALGREVNDEISEEFQEIDLGTSFAGVTIREMSIEVGLKRDYDLIYSPASSSTHGEWTALDRYALERCANPTHMWHRVPRRSRPLMVGEGLAEFLVGQVAQIVDHYVQHIA
jgi:hypothetical protein